MLRYYIDYTKKPRKIRMFLMSAQGETTGELTKVTFNKKQTFKFGGINQLSFTIPYKIDVMGKVKRNPLIKQITKKNYVKVTVDESEYEEIYAVTKKGKSDSNSSVYNIECYSSGYDLRKFRLIGYEVVSYKPSEVLHDALKGTGWSVGYIDSTLEEKRRAFNVSSKTCLDFLDEIAETYKGIIIYDTINQQINLYDEDKISKYRGFLLSNKQYIQSFDETLDEDEIVTRLYVKGADDLTIHGVNPTGKGYIDDFSYFHDVMSPSLLQALKSLDVKVEKNNLSLSKILENMKTLQKEQTEKNNELSTLKSELDIILDNIVIHGSTAELIAQRDEKKSTIKEIESKINDLKESIKVLEASASQLAKDLSYENNLTEEQLAELRRYIFIDEWSDSNITEEDDLLTEGRKYLTEHCFPPINLSLNIVNFFDIVSEQYNWDRFYVGDIVRVEHDEFGSYLDIKIKEMTIDYDQSSIDLVISNVKQLPMSDEEWLYGKILENEQTKSTFDYHQPSVNAAVSSYNARNDRIKETPVSPTFMEDGTDIQHVVNDDGTVNITISWNYPNYTETKDNAHNIDGFEIFSYISSNSDSYMFGSKLASDNAIKVDYYRRTYTFTGKVANKYHTYGIRAYRQVDPDINSNRIIYSPLVNLPECPYKPEEEVSVKGNVIGTVNGVGHYSGESPPENAKVNDKWTDTSQDIPVENIKTANGWIPIGSQVSQVEGVFYNVMTLGATGQGILPDTTAIQTGLDIARDNGSVKLYFPEGIYAVDASLRLYKNTTIEMHPNAIILRIGSHNKIFMNGEFQNSNYAALYNGDGNIHIIGGTIDINANNIPLASVNNNTTAFDMAHAENISFRNLTIKNGQNGHYFQISSCKNVMIDNCIFKDVILTNNTGNTNFEVIQIEVATSTSFPTFGSYDYTISRDVTIQNCTFENVIKAIGYHGDATTDNGNVLYNENIRILNNNFYNSLDSMINLVGYKNLIFENNVIDNVQGYAIYTNELVDSVIKANTISNIQKSAIHMLNNSRGNIITNNKYKEICLSTSSPYSAIRIDASNNNVFDDEVIYSTSPNYTYAVYGSNCSGNKILNHTYSSGKSGKIGGTLEPYVTLDCCGVGDSILRGDPTYANFQDTMVTLTPKINKYYNRGYGGYIASIPSNTSYNSIHSIMSSVETVGLYLIWIGTNDFSRDIPVGNINDAPGKIDSFYGGIKQIYESLTDKNNKATIIFITPLKRDGYLNWNTANGAGHKLVEYVNAIKNMCSMYSLPVIDLFNEAGVSDKNAATLLFDELHPNNEFNIKLGKLIGNRVNQYI